MIQYDLYRSVGSKAVRSSEIRFQAVVQSLHSAEGDLFASLEPIEDERFVGAQHACDLLHRLEARAHCRRAPLLEELTGPGRRGVLPEEVELFREQVSANGAQVAGEEFPELDGLAGGEILHALQQAPARMLQHQGGFAEAVAGAHLAGLLGTHRIDRLVHLGGDVVTVEDIQCVRGALGDHVQVRLPHVRADEADLCAALRAEPQEELAQASLFAILGHEQQPLYPIVDLVDQGEEAALAPVDLIDARGADARQVHAGPSPVDGHLHRGWRQLFLSDATSISFGSFPLLGGPPSVRLA